MNLSTKEIFHFTKFEFLKSILKAKSFVPRYNLEFTHLLSGGNRTATILPIPMVCFCDIPFELSFNHRARYGNAGIALSEKWKTENGLNPIMYIQKDSELAKVITNLTECVSEDFIPLIKDSNDFRIHRTLPKIANNLRYLTYFIKQTENSLHESIEYEGKIRTIERRKFYDEKEWRYIPFQAESNDDLFLKIWDFDKKDKLEQANDKMIEYKLNFEFSDIKYLVVENEKEKKEIIDILKDEITEIIVTK